MNNNCRVQRLSVAERFERLVDLSGYSQIELAQKIGFKNPNNITMIKQGKTKIPITRVPRIAQVFNINPADLFKQVMMEYEPEKYDVIVKCFGEVITRQERKVLRSLSEVIGEDMIKNDASKCCELIKEKLSTHDVCV